MKPRAQFFLAIGLLILGIALFTFLAQNDQPTQTFPATINRDCAPWDGAAFTVSIPYESGATITVSIWQSPDIRLPVTFSFPDETGMTGNAVHQTMSAEYKQLRGNVSFQRVSEGDPVKGEFPLTSGRGEQLNGKFQAE